MTITPKTSVLAYTATQEIQKKQAAVQTEQVKKVSSSIENTDQAKKTATGSRTTVDTVSISADARKMAALYADNATTDTQLKVSSNTETKTQKLETSKKAKVTNTEKL